MTQVLPPRAMVEADMKTQTQVQGDMQETRNRSDRISPLAAGAVWRPGAPVPPPSRQPHVSAGPGPAPGLPAAAVIYPGVLGPCPPPPHMAAASPG